MFEEADLTTGYFQGLAWSLDCSGLLFHTCDIFSLTMYVDQKMESCIIPHQLAFTLIPTAQSPHHLVALFLLQPFPPFSELLKDVPFPFRFPHDS